MSMETAGVSSLLFVYNANGSAVSRLMDAAHKIISPSTYDCDLCTLTHGNFGEKREWTQFVRGLQTPVEFLHADEFRREFPLEDEKLPAIFNRKGNAAKVKITAKQIGQCTNLDELIFLIESVLNEGPTVH